MRAAARASTRVLQRAVEAQAVGAGGAAFLGAQSLQARGLQQQQQQHEWDLALSAGERLLRSALQQQRGMFIQTQPTPNPLSLMFQPGKTVMESGVQQFDNPRAAMASPLAKRLFAIDGVTAVFFGADFITVTKKEDMPWPALKPLVFAAVMDHFASGEPILSDAQMQAADDTAIHEDDDEVVAMIKELLETRIRPAVAEDGGDITFKEFDVDSGVVMVKLAGSCSGCPSSTITLKSGIENMLMHYIPEVKGVMEAPPDESEEEGMKEFSRVEAELGDQDKEEEGGGGGGSEGGQKKEEPTVNPMAQHLSN